MNGNGIAGKRIDHQHVELLRFFAFEREARATHDLVVARDGFGERALAVQLLGLDGLNLLDEILVAPRITRALVLRQKADAAREFRRELRDLPLVAGIERADSLAFDLHKWGYLPYEIACVLVKDRAAHEGAFTLTPSYLTDEGRGVIAGGLPFADRGPELTRNFKALKVWLSFKAHGVDAIAPTFGELLLQSGRHDDVQASVTPDGLKRPPRV